MSAAVLEEYNLDTLIEDEKQEVLAQRSHILETASRKAQEKTLTLKETTDLYAKFNHTYENTLKRSLDKDDESWALKLLRECEEESIKPALETRINGEPVQNKPKFELSISNTKLTDHHPELKNDQQTLSAKPAYDNYSTLITDEEKTTIRDLFIYDQFGSDNTNLTGLKSHKSFLITMSVSVVLTLSGLIGIALFL